ncbi:hypothetical protein HRI_004509200 [Hibiscus trionum]|uniref:Uncharacterized protein n=1 Tax=Hibiscus trionum TaxID=183268 RepID=A0A9W7J6S7_HIBTR|nr:hypothetical protein HRI_004509200 [Hibiscus trionum]
MRINDNILTPDPGNGLSVEEHLRVDPSEMKMAKHDFEKKCTRMERQILRLENEKNQLKFGMQSWEQEVERTRKAKSKAGEDLSGLQSDYKKLCTSAKYADLRKTSARWKLEIQEEKERVDLWERKFRDA